MSQTTVDTSEKLSISLRWLSTKKSRYSTLAVAVGLILLVGSVWYWQNNHSVIDRQLASEASFTVYAPKTAPAGYRVDEERAGLRDGILSYGFFDPSSPQKDITVTVQAKPNQFDMAKMTGGGTVNSRAVDIGTLYDLSTGDSGQFLLDTGDVLVFITSKSSINNSIINSLVDSLIRLD